MKTIEGLLDIAGLSVNKKDFVSDLLSNNRILEAIKKWNTQQIPEELRLFMYENIIRNRSHSQIQQDLLATYISGLLNVTNGYFVEFGATNGIDLSNSLMLERDLQWRGILAEPGKSWRRELESNRNCNIDFRCVWKESGVSLEFSEVSYQRELSTIASFSKLDDFAELRSKNHKYIVETVSLQDLLEFYDAPKEIHYLSIDTEGSEYDIISKFNFDFYEFSFISIEHNFTLNEKLIDHLLEEQGYIRILPGISEWDGWYINSKHSEVCDAFWLPN
jgi:FkbM family methyltransferase